MAIGSTNILALLLPQFLASSSKFRDTENKLEKYFSFASMLRYEFDLSRKNIGGPAPLGVIGLLRKK
jgi:hypothetical protein